MSFKFADVILPLNLPQVLTYGVPHDMQDGLQAGMRVEVSLGRNKLYSAIIDRLHNDKPEAYEVKPIRSVIDNAPVVNEKQLQFWRWIVHYYVAAPGEVMQAALPAHLKLMGETRLEWIPQPDGTVHEWSDEGYLAAEALELRKELTITELKAIVGLRYFTKALNELLEHEVAFIHDALEQAYKSKKEKVVRLHELYKEEKELIALFDKLSKAPKQLELLMAYVELSVKEGIVKQQDLLERVSATGAQIKSLADKGVFVIEEVDVDRLKYKGAHESKIIEFTPAQQTAYDTVEKELETKNVVLLNGVTGSGKTLLYIHKIKQVLAEGKQALLLLPEIALTTQLVSRLYNYFGEELGVYHSRFSNNERVEIWEKVLKGTYKIVVGARSAIWLPFNDLGVIVVDEEHDPSFKQKDPAPRFNARDAAIQLAGLHHAKVVLGAATPSVESLFNAKQGKYGYAELKERYMGVRMPTIEIVNAKSLETVRKQGIKLLTPELQLAIGEALLKNKQVILFQNRRGYAPFQLCMVCGWVPQCRNCAVSLTYHKSTDKLHCHYCGLKYPIPHACPSCGSNNLVSKSFGTEKIEEEVQQIYPKARVARMDVDSVKGKHGLTQLLDDLAKHKIDILVGTQMVVKGLDFAPVSLVGILSADSLLSYPDFRVNERAFQLMEQVSGRAGRSDGVGRVLIQAHNTTHPVLQWVQDHDVQAFYDREIQYRNQFDYPPYSRMIKIIFKHKDEPRAMQGAAHMAEMLKNIEGIIIQGPVAALIARVRNLYIQEVWIKCPRDTKTLDRVKDFIKAQKQVINGQKGNANLQVLFDVDPM